MGRMLVLVFCVGLVLNVESARTHERFSQSTYYARPNGLDSTPTQEEDVKEETVIPGVESKEESKKDLIPAEVKRPEDSAAPKKEEPYTSGDFTADARPWWVNPENQNQGNSPLDEPSAYADPRYFNNNQRRPGSSFVHQDNRFPGGYYQYSKSSNGDDVPYELSSGGCPTEYWLSNTHRWPAFFNTESTLGDAFGTPAARVYGRMTMLQALSDVHDDGYHSLARNGVTALLNSYTRQQFQLPHQKVIEHFNAALVTNKVAARQAAAFDQANLSTLGQRFNSCV